MPSVEVEYKKIGGGAFVKCPVCNTFRGTSLTQLQRLKTGQRNNICPSCSRKAEAEKAKRRKSEKLPADQLKKNMKITFICENCGSKKKIRWSTWLTYQSRGEVPWCNACKNGKECSSASIVRPMMGPWPIIAGPDSELPRVPFYRCAAGLGKQECHRYDQCLDWAVATGMRSFVCGLPGRVEVCEESPSHAVLREAYEHSVELGGWLPEQTQSLALR